MQECHCKPGLCKWTIVHCWSMGMRPLADTCTWLYNSSLTLTHTPLSTLSMRYRGTPQFLFTFDSDPKYNICKCDTHSVLGSLLNNPFCSLGRHHAPNPRVETWHWQDLGGHGVEWLSHTKDQQRRQGAMTNIYILI